MTAITVIKWVNDSYNSHYCLDARLVVSPPVSNPSGDQSDPLLSSLLLKNHSRQDFKYIDFLRWMSNG